MPSRTRWKWGILFGGDNLAMADLLRYGKMADEAGADSVWTAEVWRDAQGHSVFVGAIDRE
jgi:hypothetical protein